ncbi:Antitoxin Phd_YefM, type II toxin-antitoxin system [Pseudomonas asplenii]|uniref:Antitoxin Phd_YefM, type II toxin-antitoxin system n=1 Tax=Pseudomonas asplenii TaxID=53407 RepID=A0A1H1WFA2_9PSED|nr:Antitoxin Phd_YefM, type II toxin-antitoxin system [Pseudomonas asplenii]
MLGPNGDGFISHVSVSRFIDSTELESNFEQYVEQAHNGEEFVIIRNGKPLPRLVTYQPELRRVGFCKLQTGGADFNFDEFQAADKGIEDLFFAGEIFPEDSSTDEPGPNKLGNKV